MTPALRLRLEHIAEGRPLAPRATAEDVRLLLEEVNRLELALQSALWVAADEAAKRLLWTRRPS